MSSPQLAIPSSAQAGGKRATFDRWQSIISFAIMLVLLGGLFAVAYQRGMQGPDPEPTMLAALSDEGTPHPIDTINFDPECVAQDLGAPIQLNGQWNSPNYTPAKLWIGDPQLEIYQTFVNYVVCRDERGGEDMPSDAEQTYLSPRLLFLLGPDEPSALFGEGTNLDPTEDASDVVWGGQVIPELFDPTQRIISDFPLPLNRFPSYASFNVFTGEFGSYPPFEYWDIYSLPGDRWAAMGGSITTHMLQTGAPIRTGDGELAYVSFIRQGDGFVIDEYFLICPSDIAGSLNEENESSVNQEPFDPAELIRNPEATCG